MQLPAVKQRSQSLHAGQCENAGILTRLIQGHILGACHAAE
jgi:hypothetical protein